MFLAVFVESFCSNPLYYFAYVNQTFSSALVSTHTCHTCPEKRCEILKNAADNTTESLLYVGHFGRMAHNYLSLRSVLVRCDKLYCSSLAIFAHATPCYLGQNVSIHESNSTTSLQMTFQPQSVPFQHPSEAFRPLQQWMHASLFFLLALTLGLECPETFSVRARVWIRDTVSCIQLDRPFETYSSYAESMLRRRLQLSSAYEFIPVLQVYSWSTVKVELCVCQDSLPIAYTILHNKNLFKLAVVKQERLDESYFDTTVNEVRRFQRCPFSTPWGICNDDVWC